ncbi:copper resistance CopC family protein [Actinophytocola sp.]|uniref:copper resistance CopC family protein n=1 Tax=Actinophytocola sp. TaxID=1872138 RepID=UPI002ED36DC4
MIVRRLATAFLLSGMAVIVTATPAFAHAELIASDPAQNASVAAPPQQVSLTFNEPVTLAPNPVTITGPGGAAWTVGQPSIAGAVITVPVQPSGPAGPYTLAYQVVSDDGDAINGSVQFTLTAAVPAPTTTTTPPPTTTTTEEAPPSTTASAVQAADTSDSNSGIPVWVWILGAVVVVAVGVAVALRVARPKNPGS